MFMCVFEKETKYMFYKISAFSMLRIVSEYGYTGVNFFHCFEATNLKPCADADRARKGERESG